MNKAAITRRRALAGYASLFAASPLLEGQVRFPEPSGRIAPVNELANTFEFESMAERRLGTAGFAEIAGSDRRGFERITFRPRLMVNVTKLDLSTELFGQRMFSPILVGPASEQKRFHPDGELAMVRGASAAKTAVVVSGRSSFSLAEIAGQAKAPLWYQVYLEPGLDAVRGQVQKAVDSGCKVVCLTLGTSGAAADWSTIDRLRQGIGVPLVLKGIMTLDEAQAAAKRGVGGIVISSYGGRSITGQAAPIEVLPSIVDAVGGAVPVLIDGGFRRGSDILKALALGARAVLVARPPLWGLAAYGAEGVQTVLEMLQNELARDMAMCGKPNIKLLDRTVVKIHS